MSEIIVNLHIHTRYSDGSAFHSQVALEGLESGIDVLMMSDHNILVSHNERYYDRANRRLLMLIGEELHDRTRHPQKNHLLVFGNHKELAQYTNSPQRLIDMTYQQQGLSFIAHPYDPPQKRWGETDITWEDWSVDGYNGLELWNGFSELKSTAHTYEEALFYAYFPQFLASDPPAAAYERWDSLLSTGKKLVAIGGSDAHAIEKNLLFLHRQVFPYRYHFRAINTHVLLDQPLCGEITSDRRNILEALRKGHAFIGYDLPAQTKGFRFYAQSKDATAQMGDDIRLKDGITLQVNLPSVGDCELLKDGKVMKIWRNRSQCMYISNQPGIYRVVCYRTFLGKKRSWIISNPIYVR